MKPPEMDVAMKVLNQSHPSRVEKWEGDIPHLSQGCPGAAPAARCAHRNSAPSPRTPPTATVPAPPFCPAVYTLRSDLVKRTASFVVREVWSAAHKSIVNPALGRKCLLSYSGASGQRTEGVKTVSRGGSKPCKSPQITKPGTSVDKGWARGECFSEPGGRKASSQDVRE